jgi:hypothetical protein
MSVALISNHRVLMTSQLDPHNGLNEAYEVVQTPASLLDPPADWWTVLANGLPVRHYPPHRKDLATQFATDPAYRALLVTTNWGARSRP